MASYGFIIFVAVLVFVAIVSRNSCDAQERAVFNCGNDAQTDQCNDELGDTFYTDCEPMQSPANSIICNQCIGSCTIIPESEQTNGTDSVLTCANDSCVSDVCSSYSFFANNSFGFSCRDVYTDQYCSYCENCFSFVNSSCNTDYKTVFCQLMPEELNPTCYIQFGDVACDQCAERLAGQSCDRLQYENLTPEQNQTLCSIAGSCSSLPPTFNCTSEQQLDCQLCTYLMDNNGCDFTPTTPSPPQSCSTVQGLVCSFINTLSDCTNEYSSDSCQLCSTDYSSCPLLNVNTITAEDKSILCNSTNATLCGDTVSLDYSVCIQSSDLRDCDFCKATSPICDFQTMLPSNGSNANCSSDATEQCGYDLTYFPCSILNGIQYCQQCGETIDACGLPQYASDFVPPNLCDSDVYVSLCSEIIMRDDCNTLVDKDECNFCENTVNSTCASPSNPDAGLDYFCSESSYQVCTDVLDGNEFCTEDDCHFCRSRGTLCEASTSPDQSICETDENIFCRVYGLNFTNCLSTFDDDFCRYCQTILISCSVLSLDALTEQQQQTVCEDSASCSSVANTDSFCQQDDDFTRFCDICNGFETVCKSYPVVVDSSCDSDSSLFCRVYALNLTSCLSSFSEDICSNCQSVLATCPTLTLDEFTEDQIATACASSEECEPFFNSSYLCLSEYYTESCDYCYGFQSICPDSDLVLADFCNSNSSYDCFQNYNYYPCYVTNFPPYCDYCSVTVDICFNLAFQSDFVPSDICSDTTYLSSCSVVINDPLCDDVYGEVCEYCGLVISECLPDGRLNYTTIAETLDVSCLTHYPNCLEVSSTDPNQCAEVHTRIDCAYCKILSAYCPSRNSSLPNCSSVVYDTFCSYATSLEEECDESFLPSTCYVCDEYVNTCSVEDRENSLVEFCSQTSNLFTCGDIPSGSICRYLSPEDSLLCDVCTLYSDSCVNDICSDSSLLTECSSLYENGTIPTTLSNNGLDQCLPCSIVSSTCDNFNGTEVNVTTSSVESTSSLLTPSSSQAAVQSSTTSFVISSIVPSTTSSLVQTSSETFSSDQMSITSQDRTTSTMEVTPSSTTSVITITTSVSSSSSAVPSSSSSSSIPVSSASSEITSGDTSTLRTVTSTREESTGSVSATGTIVTTITSTTTATTATEPSTITTTTTTGGTGLTTTTSATSESTRSSSTTSTSRTTSSTARTQSSSSRTTTTRSTTATTTASASPTRSPSPADNFVMTSDLTDDQRSNAVTLEFIGLTRTGFEANVESFVIFLESLLNSFLNVKKRQTNQVDVKIIEDSIEEQPDSMLLFSLFANQQGGTIVPGNTLTRAITDNGNDLAQAIGASNFSSVERGLSTESTSSSGSGGLSSGATAGIVIVVLIVIIIVLLVGAVIIYYYAVNNRKGRYYVTDDQTLTIGHELSMSQSMKEKDPQSVPAELVVKASSNETEEVKIDHEEKEKPKRASHSSSSSSSSSDSDDDEKKRNDADETTSF